MDRRRAWDEQFKQKLHRYGGERLCKTPSWQLSGHCCGTAPSVNTLAGCTKAACSQLIFNTL